MAKLEIELSEEIRTLLRKRAENTGQSEDAVVETALKRELGQQTMSANRPDLTHEEWEREFRSWVDSHDDIDAVLTNEDLRRESIYEDGL